MEFFYRLNEAAVKAGIRYKKGRMNSAYHIKRYSKNLRDQELKTILRNRDSTVWATSSTFCSRMRAWAWMEAITLRHPERETSGRTTSA
ncbi:hypothetical protein PF005_g28546 [Phytophthora fragariae]|uniref:Uncharacterized protein n=1 Tax=Phytophthora fragariae TaxID=53985 RepID=A0A6A3Q7S6_9STRA|nr:hypothetical protein PF003_g40442 [Phytophthora fragariae]KAE9069999.1 hypothetical protein PF007_g27096 [Phytophthora fragariae]KAE9077667.1 hypothetical protein PF006_g27878 [Phytophthora fragariae]KAE9168060.1 hypothetical protein PF005_g28546 [Phytophthora fragariae]KAE9178126.1 hypothetical protein PF002_g28152 [Phytophthora fragariae]